MPIKFLQFFGLKAFVHFGDILVKQVRQFEELAGEPVIFVHRLMKNHVNRRRYVLASEAFVNSGTDPVTFEATHPESVDGFGDCILALIDPSALPKLNKSDTPTMRTVTLPEHSPEWNHFPGGEKPGFFALQLSLLRLKLGF